jgi:hypothetical protein
MAPRQDLQALFESIPGVTKVYFQPPANIVLTYPCIVYKRDFAQTQFAENRPYTRGVRYQVTVMDKNPDSEIPAMIAALPMCLFDRFYTADNLNHDVFNLFF